MGVPHRKVMQFWWQLSSLSLGLLIIDVDVVNNIVVVVVVVTINKYSWC